LTNDDIRTVIRDQVAQLLAETSPDEPAFGDDERFASLGLDSLMMARLVIQLEGVLHVDPLTEGLADPADIGSVADMSAVYERAVATLAPSGRD